MTGSTTHSQSDGISVVILAGGRGTRIQSLYPETPKPMIPVKGQPFLYWLTRYLADFGLSRFIYSTGYRAEQIDDWIAETAFPGVERVARREETPLGTGGGVLNCLDLCEGAWTLVANGDGLCMSGIPDLLALTSRKDLDGGLIGLHVPDTTRYGSLEMGREGNLSAFREKVPGQGYINSGFYLFRTDVLRRIARTGPCSMEVDLIPDMLAIGSRLEVVRLDETAFIDIGTPETVMLAESFVEEHLI